MPLRPILQDERSKWAESTATKRRRIMAKAVDPVCGMELDPGQIEAQSRYQGKEYDFCSQECKRLFDENPEAYVGTGSTQETTQPMPN
jgi:YHS domain-containing protein